jgi:peptide/nickel transport system permease protein
MTVSAPAELAPDRTVAARGTGLWRRVASRVAATAATIVGLLIVTFVIGRVIPIDPVLAVVGDRAPADVYAAMRVKLGLDQPLWLQFARYAGDALRGDLGASVLTGKPVLRDIADFFPATVELATAAILIGVLAGIPAGVIAAAYHRRWPDHLLRFVSLAGYSVPVFWLGIVGLAVFYARLGWVAGPGRIDVAYQYAIDRVTGLMLVDTLIAGSFDAFVDALRHLVLPAVILGYYSLAFIARMTRTAMLAELKQEYVIAARVKGLSEARVVWRHALGNAAVPIITTVALAYAYLLEGAVLTETVFAWPGIGLYITQSLFSADMTAVLGATIVIGLCFIVLNLISDLIYPLADPRAR